MARLDTHCTSCVRRIGNRCLAFQRPAEMWQGEDECWGYTEDAGQVTRALQDIAEYTRQHGGVSTFMKDIRLVERYEEEHVTGSP